MTQPAYGGRPPRPPPVLSSTSQYLIGFSKCIQNRTKDSRVNHCRRVEAQPGKIHGDLHPKVVTNVICQGTREAGSPPRVSWDPSPLLSHESTPKGWFSHTACTQDFMRRFRMRCSWTGNTCCMMPRAASSGTAGGRERMIPAPAPYGQPRQAAHLGWNQVIVWPVLEPIEGWERGLVGRVLA